jgi:hypothetical protein
MDGKRFEYHWIKRFLFSSENSKPSVGPTEFVIQLASGFFSGVKRLKRLADIHLTPMLKITGTLLVVHLYNFVALREGTLSLRIPNIYILVYAFLYRRNRFTGQNLIAASHLFLVYHMPVPPLLTWVTISLLNEGQEPQISDTLQSLQSLVASRHFCNKPTITFHVSGQDSGREGTQKFLN